MLLHEYITSIINNTLQAHRLNQTKAAKSLGISRSTLRKYMKPEYKPGKGKEIIQPKEEPKRKSYGTLEPVGFHLYRGLKQW
jgi:hypothetical protein